MTEEDEEKGQTVEFIEALEYEDLSEQDNEEEDIIETEKPEQDSADLKGNQIQKV